jgi:hypothetical protein
LAYLVGGNLPVQSQNKKPGQSETPKTISPLLQICALDLPSATWRAQLVNSNGHLNRQYHACVSVSNENNSVLVFGGSVTATGNGQMCEEILEITPSIFGLNVNAVSRATCCSQGLSAVSSPSTLSNVAFLFGGCSRDKTYSSELSLYLHKDLPSLEGVESAMTNLRVDGIMPPARAFHACALTGPQNNLLIVHGGQGANGELLGDLWICDLSSVMNVISQAISCAASAAASTEEGEEQVQVQSETFQLPAVQWKCLADTSKSVMSRYLHAGFAYLSTKDDVEPPVPCIQFGVFGGSGSTGKSAGIELFEITIVQTDAAGEFSATDFVMKETLPVPTSTRLIGAAVASVGSDKVFSGALLFFCGPIGLLKVLDDKSDIAVATRRSVAQNVIVGKQQLATEGKQQQPVGLPKKVRYANGDIYQGQLKRPVGETDEDPVKPETLVKHGTGYMQYATGETYDGEWFDGVRQGPGVSVLAGELYQGGFWADKRHGDGTVKDLATESLIYQGQFQNGLFHGKGRHFAPDGVYEGDFQSGVRQGQGRLVNNTDGFQYDGNWSNNSIAGVGAVRDHVMGVDGSALGSARQRGVYHGPTLDGVPSGSEGLCAYQDGSEYRGQWKSGKRNGVGQYVAPNNDVFDGKWVGDQKWKGRWTSAKGNEFYDGFWLDGKPHGLGSRLYADGSKVECQWVHGRRVGAGQSHQSQDMKQWGGNESSR